MKFVFSRNINSYLQSSLNSDIVETNLNTTITYKRRVRYSGLHPKEYEHKYKEIRGDESVSERVTSKGSTPAGQHIPIMLTECLVYLDDVIQAKSKNIIALDCTLGYGGHSKEIIRRLSSLSNDSILYGIDQDEMELKRTTQRLNNYAESLQNEKNTRFNFVSSCLNFGGIKEFLENRNLSGKIDFLMADLGLSSMQINNSSRGFSHKKDGPLDMRMNTSSSLTAYSYLCNVSVHQLAEILSNNSDEPLAIPIAHALLGLDFKASLSSTSTSSKASKPSKSPSSRTIPNIPNTTLEFRKRIEDVCAFYGKATGRTDVITKDFISSTAARVMQAIRIEVNSELDVLDTLLASLPAALAPGGRVVILTFHSGEDRRVKQAFKKGCNDGIYMATSREVGRATEEERKLNPRSKSAKLRWAIRA